MPEEIPFVPPPLALPAAHLNPVMNFFHPPDPKHIHPALIIAEGEDPSTEIIEKRTPLSKTFRTGPNEFRLITGPNIVHYNENGRMQEIDLNIEDVDGKKMVTKAPYKIEIYTDRVGYHLQQPDGSNVIIELVKIGGKPVDNALLRSRVEGCQMFWEGIHEGITMKLLLLAQRPNIYTHLLSADVPKAFTWKVVHEGQYEFKSFGHDSEKNFLEIKVDQERIDDQSFSYNETWTGRVSRKDKKTRIKNWFNDPVYPVTIDPSVSINIITGADDGFQKITIGIRFPFDNWYSSKIYVGSTAHAHRFIYLPGFRFQDVGVPNKATIISARLKVYVGPPNIDGIKAFMAGALEASANYWTDQPPNKISPLAVGGTWHPFTSNDQPTLNSITMTAPVASIVNLTGWVSKNAMRFLVSTVSNTSNFGKDKVYDFNTAPTKAALLVINYSTAAPSGNPRAGDMNIMGL